VALKILYQSITGEFDRAMMGIYRPIAEAGSAAITEAANTIKTEGRADIATAGFGKKWQNTFRVDTFPRGGKVSANAAALIYHKIPYADVFETGATIRGKPKLWIPLKSTPKKIGTRRMTAKLFTQEVGPLFPVKRTGGKPLLAAKMAVSSRAAKTGILPKPTLGKLRDGATSAGVTRAVPLFVGVDSVKLRDRFSLREITDRAATSLPALYAKYLNPEG
jgi:hypothetical protein